MSRSKGTRRRIRQVLRRASGRRCPATGSICYPSAARAAVHLHSLAGTSKQSPAEIARLQKYLCRTCGSWHVGHRTESA